MIRRPVLSTADLDAEVATALPLRETMSCQFACVNVTNVIGECRHDQLTGERPGDAVPRLGPDAVIPIRRRLCCSGAAAVLSSDPQSTPER